MAQETTKRRRTWTNDQLKAAIEACMSGEIGYLKAQTTFGVPRGTLHRFIKLKKSNPNLDFDDLLGIKLGRKPVFSLQLEKELTSYCLEMERRFFGLTKSDVLRIAYQLATLSNFTQINSLNTWDATGHCFRLTLNKNGTKTRQKPYSRPVQQ
jgi:hypothetical protein